MLELAKKGHIAQILLTTWLKTLNIFRKSYQITAKIVNYCDKTKKLFQNCPWKR